MNNLDNIEIYNRFDPEGMLQCISELPQQIKMAWESAKALNLPSDYRDINKVIILGIGGSAIGGDLLRSIALSESHVPVFVHRGYELPYFVDSDTLVIASSYSGQTEETLSAFQKAMRTDSKKLVITTGGMLKTIADNNNIPACIFDYKSQPRAALGYNLGLLIGVFQNLGLLSDKSGEIEETVDVLNILLSQFGVTVPVNRNKAKQLAIKLVSYGILIYGADIFSEVAHRWKTQLNENSKTWAFHEMIPELNHNTIVGYEFPKEIIGKVFTVILQSDLIHPRNKKQCELVMNILGKTGIKYEVVSAEGENCLSQMMSLVLLGDYVSYYLAILYETDPSPVDTIRYLKNKLAE